MTLNKKTIGGLAVASILAIGAPAFAASQSGPARASVDGKAEVHAKVGDANVDGPTTPTTELPAPPTTEVPSVQQPEAPQTPQVTAPKRPSTSGVRTWVRGTARRVSTAVQPGPAPSVPPAPSTSTPTPPSGGGGGNQSGDGIEASADANISLNAHS